MLSTRSAWEQHGEVILRPYLQAGAWGALATIWSHLARLVPEPAVPESAKILAAVHVALAKVILAPAEAAAEHGDHAAVLTALAAALQLDPPPPITRALARLKKFADLPDRAKERIGVGLELFKSADGRAPTIGGLFEATRILRAQGASEE